MAPSKGAQLPVGNASILSGLSENFSFHSSPESFITSRILQHARSHPELVASRTVVRARILNRNVAVVSSHAQIQQVLSEDRTGETQPAYVASAAYDELMAPFFPSPNLLLADGSAHADMRHNWESRMAGLPSSVDGSVASITREHLEAIPKGRAMGFDIYEYMKTLSWKILLGIFLQLRPDDSLFATVEGLQEDLLRGQFSLVPVSVNTGIWRSPRNKGIKAKEKLQTLILERIKSGQSRGSRMCPFATNNEIQLVDVANHILLFTSSLAAKALASLLTAFLLNLYCFPHRNKNGIGFMVELAAIPDREVRIQRLKDILLETERLSPPIVGIMRRSTRENVIQSPSQADILIPKDWDVWLYFVGGGRDPAAFGESWGHFDPDRFLDERTALPAAFGAGPKTCLGRGLMRQIATAIAETCLDMDLRMECKIRKIGVRGWLGWEENDKVKPDDWAAHMKQLPTQRPSEPVAVRISRGR